MPSPCFLASLAACCSPVPAALPSPCRRSLSISAGALHGAHCRSPIPEHCCSKRRWKGITGVPCWHCWQPWAGGGHALGTEVRTTGDTAGGQAGTWRIWRRARCVRAASCCAGRPRRCERIVWACPARTSLRFWCRVVADTFLLNAQEDVELWSLHQSWADAAVGLCWHRPRVC